MRSATQRDVLRIERPVVTQDDRGRDVYDWKPVATIRGELRQGTGGGENQAAMQIVAETDHTLKIRYIPGLRLDSTMRVVELATGLILDIVTIRDLDGRNRRLEIALKAHAGADTGGLMRGLGGRR